MPHLSGDKISDSHTTAIDAAESIVKRLHKDPRVKKMTLGKIENSAGSGKSGVKRIKIIDEEHCIKVAVSGNSSDQDLWVYLKDNQKRSGVKDGLREFAQNEGYTVSTMDRRG